MLSKKDTTTIVFLNKNQNCNKPIRISTFYIQNWKKIAFSLLLLCCIPLVVSIALYKNQSEMQTANNQLKILLAKQRHELVQLDTGAIRKHYLSIDEKLQTINRFMKARGLKPIHKSAGGEVDKTLGSTEEIGSFYEEYLKRMVKLVAFTPIGYPHKGRISSSFGHRENPLTGENIERHKGLDIKGAHGEVVKTTANGRVKFAGRKGGYGNCVIVDHGNGFETYYGHLSKISVKVNQMVTVGQQIGNIGSTGRSTGPHLHYEIHKNGKVLNPKLYLSLETCLTKANR